MKQIRIISSVLSVIALLLCAWSLFKITQEGTELLRASLNFIYFSALLISFLCLRISFAYSNGINPITATLTIVLISLSTCIWINPPELLVFGKFTLGLVPLLLGSTLMLIVKADTKLSKIIQFLLGTISVTLASCVFLELSKTLIYTVAFIGMIIATLALLFHFIFTKTIK